MSFEGRPAFAAIAATAGCASRSFSEGWQGGYRNRRGQDTRP